jgi:hypothetical protein
VPLVGAEQFHKQEYSLYIRKQLVPIFWSNPPAPVSFRRVPVSRIVPPPLCLRRVTRAPLTPPCAWPACRPACPPPRAPACVPTLRATRHRVLPLVCSAWAAVAAPPPRSSGWSAPLAQRGGVEAPHLAEWVPAHVHCLVAREHKGERGEPGVELLLVHVGKVVDIISLTISLTRGLHLVCH